MIVKFNSNFYCFLCITVSVRTCFVVGGAGKEARSWQ